MNGVAVSIHERATWWDAIVLFTPLTTMTTNGRHPQSIGTKRPHVLDPVEGYEAGIASAQSCMGSWFPLSTASSRIAGEAGPRTAWIAHCNLCPRVLLARALLPEGQGSSSEQSFLEGKVHREQGTGPKECSSLAQGWLASANRVGVLLINGEVARGTYRQIVESTDIEARLTEVTWRGLCPQSASIRPGGTVNLEGDSRRQTGDAWGGNRAPRVFGALAAILSSLPHG